MYYSYGNITIPKQQLIDFLKGLNSGIYSTFDILEKYQGSVTRNKGIPAQKSWNANFGKILKQCSNNTTGIIVQKIPQKKIIIDGGSTNTSYWQVN